MRGNYDLISLYRNSVLTQRKIGYCLCALRICRVSGKYLVFVRIVKALLEAVIILIRKVAAALSILHVLAHIGYYRRALVGASADYGESEFPVLAQDKLMCLCLGGVRRISGAVSRLSPMLAG